MFVNVKAITPEEYRRGGSYSKPQLITINTEHIVAIYEGYLVMSIKFGKWHEAHDRLAWRNRQPFIPLWDGEWNRLTKLLEANK